MRGEKALDPCPRSVEVVPSGSATARSILLEKSLTTSMSALPPSPAAVEEEARKTLWGEKKEAALPTPSPQPPYPLPARVLTAPVADTRLRR